MRMLALVIIFCNSAGYVLSEEDTCAFVPRRDWITEDQIARIMSALGTSEYWLAVEDGCIEVNYVLDGNQYEARMDPVSGKIVELFRSFERRL